MTGHRESLAAVPGRRPFLADGGCRNETLGHRGRQQQYPEDRAAARYSAQLITRLPDTDHNIADLLPRLDVPVRINDLIQLIPPVDNRLELSRLDQPLEVPHHFWLFAVSRSGTVG